jgi:hypothetical protein
VDYWVGGDEKARNEANERGREAIFGLGANRGQLRADLAKAEGDSFYFLTDRFGTQYFHYGTPRTIADLKP